MRAFIKSLHYSISDNTKLYFLNISITNILLEFIKISYKHQDNDVVYKYIYIYISLLKCYIRTIKINAVVKMYSLNSDHFDFQNKHLFFLFSSKVLNHTTYLVATISVSNVYCYECLAKVSWIENTEFVYGHVRTIIIAVYY